MGANCYDSYKEENGMDIPILYKINNIPCFGFLCNILLNKYDDPHKILLFKLTNDEVLSEKIFEEQDISLEFNSKGNKVLIGLCKNKRIIYIYNHNIMIIEIKRNEALNELNGIDYFYSEVTKKNADYYSFNKKKLPFTLLTLYKKKQSEIQSEKAEMEVKEYACEIKIFNFYDIIFECKSIEFNKSKELKESIGPIRHLIGNPIIEGKSQRIVGIVTKVDGKNKNNYGIRFEYIISKYIENIEKNNIIESKRFCEAFILISISNKPEIMGKSKNYSSDSKDLTFEPKIIYKYPYKNELKELLIDDSVPYLCFPEGIKIYYNENEENIKTVSNYSTLLRNNFFLKAYYGFFKMINNNFITYYNKNSKINELIKGKDNIYIPFCICLISKNPFYKQMEICLQSVMMAMKDENTKPYQLNQLINYIIKRIPLPPINSTVSFSLPYNNEMCEIQAPFIEGIFNYNDNLIIFKKLSIDDIIIIFNLLIMEERIMVVGKKNEIISKIILNFLSLLYPLKWEKFLLPTYYDSKDFDGILDIQENNFLIGIN